jgi:hypothetical protein
MPNCRTLSVVTEIGRRQRKEAELNAVDSVVSVLSENDLLSRVSSLMWTWGITLSERANLRQTVSSISFYSPGGQTTLPR